MPNEYNTLDRPSSLIVNAVTDFRALGDGTNDDRIQIQKAIDFVADAGGGQVFLPATRSFYAITRPLIVRPKVSLVGGSTRPVVRNITSTGGIGVQEVLLSGNFHPDFTEDLPYRDCGTITPGYTVTLTNPAQAAEFAVGEQVFVASTAGALANGFFVPDYGFLNIVTAISGATITLREPIDVTFAGRIARLAAGLGRNGIPLFFAQDAVVSDLTLVATNYTVSNDSATLNVTWQRLTTVGRNGIYGNTFQRTRWVECDMYWHQTMGEQSHNSYRNEAERCRFIYLPSPAFTPTFGISIQEAARHIYYTDCYYEMGPSFSVGSIFRTQNAQNVRFRGGNVSSASPSYTGNAIAIETSARAEFPATDCVVEDMGFNLASCGRYFWLDARGIPENTRNGLLGVRFSGPASVSDSIRFTGSTGNFIERDCVFPVGQMQFSGTNSGNTVVGNFIGGGFQAQGSAVEALFQTNFIRRNRSSASVAKQIARRAVASDITVAAGITTDIYDANVGSNVILRDRFEFEVSVNATGSTGDRTLRWYIFDATATTSTTVFSVVIPAAETGQNNITGYLYFMGNNLVFSWTRVNAAGVTTAASGRIVAPNRANNLSVRIEASMAGNSAITVQRLGADVTNPWFD